MSREHERYILATQSDAERLYELELVTINIVGQRIAALSPNCDLNQHKIGENQASPENKKFIYLTAGKGTYLDFMSDCEVEILGFKAAAFNRSATPQLPIPTYSAF